MKYEDFLAKIFEMFLNDNADFGGDKSQKVLENVRKAIPDVNTYIDIESDIAEGFVEQSQNAFIFGFRLASLLKGETECINIPGVDSEMEVKL